MIWQIAITVAIFAFVAQHIADHLHSVNYWTNSYADDTKWYNNHRYWEAARDWSRLLCVGAVVVGMVAFIWAIKL